MRLERSNMESVLRGIKDNTTPVRNVKQYLLAALYNAPMTTNAELQLRYNCDHANGKV